MQTFIIVEKHDNNDFSAWHVELQQNFFAEHTNEGDSVRGTLQQVLEEMQLYVNE